MLTGPEVPIITRAQMFAAFEALGIDPASTRSLSIRRHYVEVELMVVDDKGKHCAAGNEVATAVMKIPIVDNMFEAQVPVTTGDGKQIAVDAGVN